MASPQTENGFTKIANEVFEELVKTALLGAEFQICFFVIRKTYGYNKKEDRISLTQFEKGTNLSRPTVVKSLKNLVAKNVLKRSESLIYKFNKDYETWVVNTALLVKHNDATSKDRFTKIGKDGLTHKRKKKMTKENIAGINPADIVSVIETFSKLNPACSRMYGNKTQRQASEDLIATYGKERIESIIRDTLPKTNKIKFFPTITTPVQLRDKFIMLESAIIRYKQANKSTVAF
jgi:phage replication O-like protein O